MDNAEKELLLLIAVSLSPSNIKDIAISAGLKPSLIYKWKTSGVHLSPKKIEALLKYFIENEPVILIMAEIVVIELLLLYSKSSILSE